MSANPALRMKLWNQEYLAAISMPSRSESESESESHIYIDILTHTIIVDDHIVDMEYDSSTDEGTAQAMLKELDNMEIKHGDLQDINTEMKNELRWDMKSMESMKKRYLYLERKYADSKVRSESENVEVIYDGMEREREATDVLVKYDLLERDFKCSM